MITNIKTVYATVFRSDIPEFEAVEYYVVDFKLNDLLYSTFVDVDTVHASTVVELTEIVKDEMMERIANID